MWAKEGCRSLMVRGWWRRTAPCHACEHSAEGSDDQDLHSVNHASKQGDAETQDMLMLS